MFLLLVDLQISKREVWGCLSFDFEVGMPLRSFSLKEEDDLILAEGTRPYSGTMYTRKDPAEGCEFPCSYQIQFRYIFCKQNILEQKW